VFFSDYDMRMTVWGTIVNGYVYLPQGFAYNNYFYASFTRSIDFRGGLTYSSAWCSMNVYPSLHDLNIIVNRTMVTLRDTSLSVLCNAIIFAAFYLNDKNLLFKKELS
jgi:hypothetical protein